MRTETVTFYTARELREHHPRGFARALRDHADRVARYPAWIDEHRESLAAALDAIGDDPPDIEGPRRVMAWLENNVLDPLRIPWRGDGRWSLARYGSHYRAGTVKPCPWTGFYTDDALLDEMRGRARQGIPPRGIARHVEDRARALWESELEDQASEDAFLESADANGWEYYADGRMV